MKILHQHRGMRDLRKYELDSSDKKEFAKLRISEPVIKRLCAYLHPDKVVTIEETYDGQSGWQGFTFVIDGKDLSINGFCFGEGALIRHLDEVDQTERIPSTPELRAFVEAINSDSEIKRMRSIRLRACIAQPVKYTLLSTGTLQQYLDPEFEAFVKKIDEEIDRRIDTIARHMDIGVKYYRPNKES